MSLNTSHFPSDATLHFPQHLCFTLITTSSLTLTPILPEQLLHGLIQPQPRVDPMHAVGGALLEAPRRLCSAEQVQQQSKEGGGYGGQLARRADAGGSGLSVLYSQGMKEWGEGEREEMGMEGRQDSREKY